MSGCVARVLLRSRVPEWRLGEVAATLGKLSSDVCIARRGTHWDFAADPDPNNASRDWHAPRHYTLDLVDTETHDYDWESTLLAHDLLFEDAPEGFVLNGPIGDSLDRDFCRALSLQLAEQFGGFDLGLAT